ncbi:MAG: SIMPL domain-containing protein [Propionicimonas sp.]
MGILRITVDDRGCVTASSAKLNLVVKGATAVVGNAAVKRAAEVRALVAALAEVGVGEEKVEVSSVTLASTTSLLGRNQRAEIALTVAVEPDQLPAVLGILADAPNLSLEGLEWVFDSFEASIPLTAQAMVKARRKADAVASAAGLRITGIANASDSWNLVSPRPEAMAYAAPVGARALKSSPELDLGLEYSSSTEITVHLSVDFEMGA